MRIYFWLDFYAWRGLRGVVCVKGYGNIYKNTNPWIFLNSKSINFLWDSNIILNIKLRLQLPSRWTLRTQHHLLGIAPRTPHHRLWIAPSILHHLPRVAPRTLHHRLGKATRMHCQLTNESVYDPYKMWMLIITENCLNVFNVLKCSCFIK